MKQEVKQKVNFEDFGLKPVDIKDLKNKEEMVLAAIRKGEMPQELICGEIKLQFDEGVNLIEVPGKPIPFIGLSITSYTNDGQKVEQQLYSNPCIEFRKGFNFKTAVNIPMVNKDKVIYALLIMILEQNS